VRIDFQAVWIYGDRAGIVRKIFLRHGFFGDSIIFRTGTGAVRTGF